MSENTVIYSIQRTYILTNRMNDGKEIVTCEQRIDIPTIEPLSQMQPVAYPNVTLTVVPCIELAGAFLSEFDLTLDTNEGVTVLPVKIYPLETDPEVLHKFENPYTHFRYVLVLPRGATGVKSCKLIHKATGKEVQHNFTFGIMPPPHNYDNALFGVISTVVNDNSYRLSEVEQAFGVLKLTTIPSTFAPIELTKGSGGKTIKTENSVLFYETHFIYSSSSEPTVHKPKITLHANGADYVYTLSLNKNANTVSIDLFTGMITVYDEYTGEIMKQIKLAVTSGVETLSFENFDDIITSKVYVTPRGARVSV